MATIFISYRKEDTRPWAIALRDRLVRTFGQRHVFLDIDSMAAGGWRTQITRALEGCRVVLVLIGQRWTASTDSEGRNRLFLPDDVHRAELVTALSTKSITVIPILVDEARVPQPDDLPEDLKGLLDHQIYEIGYADHRRAADMHRLVRAIEDVTGQRRQRQRAGAAAVAATAVALTNSMVTLNSLPVAAAFLVMAAVIVPLSWWIHAGMARQHVKGAWMALIALTLSAAMLVGSVVRLLPLLSLWAQTTWIDGSPSLVGVEHSSQTWRVMLGFLS